MGAILSRGRNQKSSVRLSVTLDTAEHEALLRLGAKLDLSTAWMIRRAVSDFVGRYGNDPDSELPLRSVEAKPVENDLGKQNEAANPLLYRIAFKMATGSGKTVVMAMLIAWQALNKLANPQDARFSDSFLIVTPGITIRDRLRVLLPNDPQNYFEIIDPWNAGNVIRALLASGRLQ
jgi:hypothetical protein